MPVTPAEAVPWPTLQGRNHRFLRPLAHRAEDNIDSARIQTIGIPTRNRLKSATRALASYAANARSFERKIRFVISDDAPETQARHDTRSALADLARIQGAELIYFGQEERLRLVNTLARRSAVSPEIIRFGLMDTGREGISTGTSRNTLLLLSLGERLVCVDDDTVCNIAAVGEQREGMVLHSGRDISEFWFFADHAATLSAARFVDVDFIGCHERLLGRTLESLVSEHGGPAHVDSEFAREGRLSGPAFSSTVAATALGVIGDSALPSSRAYLLLEGASHERLVRSESEYRAAIESRQLMRSVCQLTISETPISMD